jgi:large subunit ribosomal protein L15
MPPRLPLRSLATLITPPPPTLPTTATSIPTFLLPFLTRSASILSNLRNVPSSYNARIRVGRGPSSRKGGKSGRGHKGQKQKGGWNVAGFAGGQTPDHVVHGHYGFTNNQHKVDMTAVNLDKIQEWINLGRLDASKPITLRELCVSRVVGKVKDGVKLLAKNGTDLTTPIHVVVSRASKSAIAAVEALGGSVTTRFYTHAAIRRIRKGDMHPYVSLQWDQSAIGNAALMVKGAEEKEEVVKGLGYEFRLPDPTSRKDLEYYRDRENRGYLSHRVKEGHSPSLFYATEAQIEDGRRAKEEARKAGVVKKNKTNAEENKLW